MIYILLGTNQGNRLSNLQQARTRVSRQVGEIITASSLYETAAWGNVQQPDFYNQVIAVQSMLTPHEALQELLSIEQAMGRTRIEKWGPRIIDLDILLWGELILHDTNLVIPHAGIPFRKFTLFPMAEIAPDLVHPQLHKKITQLLAECPDRLEVRKLEYVRD